MRLVYKIRMRIYRLEFTTALGYCVVTISAPTLLDAVCCVLDLCPDADFELCRADPIPTSPKSPKKH